MNPQDPLAALRPLREPELVGWWPPAPGWWLLALLALGLLLASLVYLYRRHRDNAWRRLALRQLQHLSQRYREQGDGQRYLQQLNALLKAVALNTSDRRDVAGLSGKAWVDYLNQGLAGDQHFDPALQQAPYCRSPELPDLSPMEQLSAQWIKRRRSRR